MISKYGIITIFLVLLIAFAPSNGVATAISKTSKNRKVARINPADIAMASAFDKMPITLHPGSTFDRKSKSTPQTSARCKSVVYQTLNSLPENHSGLLTNLTLYFTPAGRRGYGAGNTIILRCLNVEDYELAAVLAHEIGHLVDTSIFYGSKHGSITEFDDFGEPVYDNDLSVQFYRISFRNSLKTYENASPLDFVSGYAMSDPFEDFAETYAYYILHGPEFRSLSETNEALRQKYFFMRDFVFGGREFGLNSAVAPSFFDLYRNYDVTVLPYDVQGFFRAEF